MHEVIIFLFPHIYSRLQLNITWKFKTITSCLPSCQTPFNIFYLRIIPGIGSITPGSVCTQVAGPSSVTCSSACLSLTHTRTHKHTQFYTQAVISQPTPDDQLFGCLLSASLWFRDHNTASRHYHDSLLTAVTCAWKRARTHIHLVPFGYGWNQSVLAALEREVKKGDNWNKREKSAADDERSECWVPIPLRWSVVDDFSSMTEDGCSWLYFFLGLSKYNCYLYKKRAV